VFSLSLNNSLLVLSSPLCGELPLGQLCMFCLQRHSMHWISSTEARSKCIIPRRSIQCILPLGIRPRHYLFQTQRLQRRISMYFLMDYLLTARTRIRTSTTTTEDLGVTISDSTRPRRRHPHLVLPSLIASLRTFQPHH